MTRRIVASTIKYLGPCSGKPIFYGSRSYLDNLPLEVRAVQVEDLRIAGGETTLDREGFAIVGHRSAVEDFSAPEAVRGVYLMEIAALLKAMTGAIEVLATTSVIRRSERSHGFCKDGTTVPGRFVHCDFSPNPAGSSFWVEKLLHPIEFRERLRRRFALYNVWRPLSDPPQDVPLAVCDARSVGPHDRVCSDCVEELPEDPQLRFELSVFRYSPQHRWCYFSNMTRDEVLVFKGFDSDPGRANGIPHVAFDDPSCPADAPARESIDTRFMAFFDD